MLRPLSLFKDLHLQPSGGALADVLFHEDTKELGKVWVTMGLGRTPLEKTRRKLEPLAGAHVNS